MNNVKSTLNHSNSWQAIVLSILLFFSFQPFYIWHTKLLPIITIASSLLIIFNKKMTTTKNICFFAVLFILYLYVGIKGNYTLIGILVIINMLPLVLLKEECFRNVFNNFYTLFSILIGISLVFYILIMFIGINLPHSSIAPLNPLKEAFTEYDKYPFLLMCRSYGFYQPRFEGYFDEPGVVGTISAVLLLSRKFDIKDIFSWPILLSGIFSLSMFFYVVLFFYILLYSPWQTRLILLIISIAMIAILYQNEIVNNLLFSRFRLEDGGLSGDNRKIGLSESWYKSFCDSSSFWIGLGNQAHIRYNNGGASYSDLIIDYGAIFFVFYIIIFIIEAYIKIKNFKLIILYGFIFGGILYQRPFITEMCYFFILIMPLYMLRGTYNEKNINKYRNFPIYAD